MRDIQADDALIGELVKCPFCQSTIAVPDPFPVIGSEKNGYTIESILFSTLLFNMYQATSPPQSTCPSTRVLLQVPSFFFLKRTADFNLFSTAVINSGSMNIPGTPRLLEYSLNPGGIFFAYDFFESSNLENFARNTGPFPPLDALSIIKQCAGTLHNVWANYGIIHQNLSPNSILLDSARNILLMDLGISQTLRQDKKLLDSGFNIWDPHYMSPEFALSGEGFSPACDIYSLGMTLYFLLTGNTPNGNLSSENIPATAPPDPTNAIPPGFNDVISLYRKMVAPNPAERLSSWEELVGDVDIIFNNPLHSATAAAPPRPIATPLGQASVSPSAPTPANQQENDIIANFSKKGSKTEKNRHFQNLKKKNREKGFFEKNMGLVLTCFIVFVLAVPLIAFWMHKQKKKRENPRRNEYAQSASNVEKPSADIPKTKEKPTISPKVAELSPEELPPGGETDLKSDSTGTAPNSRKKTLTQKVLDVKRYLLEGKSKRN